MRILAVTNLFPNPIEPQLGTFNRHQLRALATEHSVNVIAPIAWTDERSARRTGVPPLPQDRRLVWDGLPVEYPRFLYVPRWFRSSYGRSYRWSIRRA